MSSLPQRKKKKRKGNISLRQRIEDYSPRVQSGVDPTNQTSLADNLAIASNPPSRGIATGANVRSNSNQQKGPSLPQHSQPLEEISTELNELTVNLIKGQKRKLEALTKQDNQKGLDPTLLEVLTNESQKSKKTIEAIEDYVDVIDNLINRFAKERHPKEPKKDQEQKVTESDLKVSAELMEAADGGHSLARHGPKQSMTMLERRLYRGIAPDEEESHSIYSTKFTSIQGWFKAIENAYDAIERSYGLAEGYFKEGTPPEFNPNITYEMTVEYNGEMGKGAVADVSSKYYFENQKGKSSYGFLKSWKVTGLTRVYTKIGWQRDSWVLLQHYPTAQNWSQEVGAYTKEPDSYWGDAYNAPPPDADQVDF